jgi:hypothetical protein
MPRISIAFTDIMNSMKDFIIGVPIGPQTVEPHPEVDLSDTIKQAELLLSKLKEKNEQLVAQKVG